MSYGTLYPYNKEMEPNVRKPMVLVTKKRDLPENCFVAFQRFKTKVDLPRPPTHFRYECRVINDNIHHYEIYRIVTDETNPPPSFCLLRLEEMRVKDLQKFASDSGLKGWTKLGKADLIRFLETHKYIFPDMFYEQRAFSKALKAWAELFASTSFAVHYAEIIKETLTRVSHSIGSTSFSIWAGFRPYTQLLDPMTHQKRDSYLRGIRDPFSETFEPVSDLNKIRQVRKRDKEFDQVVSEIETEMRYLDWGNRVFGWEEDITDLEELLALPPVVSTFANIYDEVEMIGYLYPISESDQSYCERVSQEKQDIMSEEKWMECRKVREELLGCLGDGLDKDADSEIIKRERKEGWKELMWERWGNGTTKGCMTRGYILMNMSMVFDIHHYSYLDTAEMEERELFD